MDVNLELVVSHNPACIKVIHVSCQTCSILAYCPEEDNVDSGLCLLPLGCFPEREACSDCPYTYDLVIAAVEMMHAYLRKRYGS